MKKRDIVFPPFSLVSGLSRRLNYVIVTNVPSYLCTHWIRRARDLSFIREVIPNLGVVGCFCVACRTATQCRNEM